MITLDKINMVLDLFNNKLGLYYCTDNEQRLGTVGESGYILSLDEVNLLIDFLEYYKEVYKDKLK